MSSSLRSLWFGSFKVSIIASGVHRWTIPVSIELSSEQSPLVPGIYITQQCVSRLPLLHRIFVDTHRHSSKFLQTKLPFTLKVSSPPTLTRSPSISHHHTQEPIQCLHPPTHALSIERETEPTTPQSHTHTPPHPSKPHAPYPPGHRS